MTTDTDLVRLAVVVLVLLFLAPMLLMIVAMPMMGHMWGGTATPVGWLFSALVGLLVVAGVAYLLYRLVGTDRQDPALEELRLAYARGELSDEEFETRRERLSRER